MAVRANMQMDFRVIKLLITNLIPKLLSDVIEAVWMVPLPQKLSNWLIEAICKQMLGQSRFLIPNTRSN